jgi:DnaJ-class molecular chaperone
MMNRLDLKREDCIECDGTGRDPKKRKRPCRTCDGTGKHSVCQHCGGIYGTECIDDRLDQTYCSQEK